MENISKSEIESQIARILATEPFQRSERLSTFLQYIIREYLNNNSDQIKAYSIAISVFDRPKSFDAGSDNIVRVYGGMLRRELKHYYESAGRNDTIIINVPKGAYIPVIRHKDTLGKSSEKTRPASAVPLQIKPSTSDPAIVVANFEILNEEDDSGYLDQGLTHEILIALTKFFPLQVLGPIESAKYKPINFSDIRRRTGAQFVLEGLVQTTGKKIKISTTLSDTPKGRKLWGNSYRYDLEKNSLYEIEDEVAGQIAAIVGDGLGIIFRKLQSDSYHNYIRVSDVTEAVLLYNKAWTTQAPQDWASALIAVGKALDSRPTDALLLALQSNIYYADVLHDLNIFSDSRSEMEPLGYKAISVDPDLQLARYNLVVQHAFHGRGKKCIEEAKKVVAMNPNHARLLAGCAVATSSVEAYDFALELIERAKKLNPHYPGWYHFINYLVHYSNGRYEEAWAEAQNIHVEGLFWHPIIRAAILGKLGRINDVAPYIRELLEIKPDFLKRPHDFIRLLFVSDKHIEMIWDGLQKAGIEKLDT